VFFLATDNLLAEYRFDVWTADSGLPQNSVRAIVQTRDGYLWVGTLDGLARFDGVRFTVFNRANTPALPSNGVLSLYEDFQGALWIGFLDGGLARYYKGKFNVFGATEGLAAGGVIGISGDEKANLWACVDGVILQLDHGRFRPAVAANAPIPPGARFQGTSAGIFWTRVEDEFQVFARGKLETLSVGKELPRAVFNVLIPDQHENWWLATESGELVKIRDGKIVKTYGEQDGLPREIVGTRFGFISCEDRKGNIWVGATGPWLGRLKDGIFSGYPSANTQSSQPLPQGQDPSKSGITVFFEDREGNLWIGTHSYGLIRAREQAVNVFSIREGLQKANIYPVLEDRAGGIWLGVWNFGIARIEAGVATNFPLGPRRGEATAFCQDRTGRLWVGCLNGIGIFQGDQFNVAEVPAQLTNQPVNAIYEDHAGAIWFGAEPSLFCYREGRVSSFNERDGLAGGIISVITEAAGGSLWIGSQAGLTRITKGRFTAWTEQNGLPSKHVRALYEDAEQTLWIGTADGGLARFKDDRFTRYTTKEGLFDDGVFQILEDSSGTFWMSSNRGIHTASKRELNEFAEGRRHSITSVAYGKSDGMLNAECNGGRSPAGVKTHDGKLWFPTQDGVAVIDPASLQSNTNPPPVVIESFVLDRQPQPLDAPLRVPPGKAYIEIQYSGLSFVNSERLSFKYKLAPADSDWVEAGTRRSAYYSHIAPGDYTFTVLAANSDGIWSPAGASLAFNVLPAWYQTWWARGICGAIFAGLLFGAYRQRLARVERARTAEQEFSRRLMQSQEQERQRLAAELHDSVGQSLLVIKNRAVMALEHSADPGRVSEQITEVSTVASQALREVRGMAQDLRPFQLDEMGLTKALVAMTRRLADSSTIRFHTDVAELNGELPKDREIHFYRIVQELLTNIVKHSKATEANLTIRKAGAVLRALIQDNGSGFDASETSGESPSQAGFGLRGIRERVRTLEGRLQLDSRAGDGTTVVIEVPVETGQTKRSQQND
jgi:signal transduction histidine kinase/ligand-binding sensor domain-containing protein